MSDRPVITLPRNVVSFDIETEMVEDWRNREVTPVLFVGWKRYPFDAEKGWYDETLPYRWVPAEKLNQSLFDQMGSLDGVIIGHNLLDFDWRVLWQHGDLSRVVDRTCDTLTILRSLHRGKGLKLDDLGRVNFGERKTCEAQEAIEYFKDPERRHLALEYNEQDCALVFKVWEQLVRKHKIEIDAGGYRQTLSLTLPLLETLTGNRQQISAAEYLRKYPKLQTTQASIGV